MSKIIDWLKRGIVALTYTLLAILALILFAVLAVAMRPLLIVLGIFAVVVSLVFYQYSPAFREWLDAAD